MGTMRSGGYENYRLEVKDTLQLKSITATVVMEGR